MMSDWPLVTIDELKADEKGAIAIGPFGSRLKSDNYVDSGIPVIRGTNITGGPNFEGELVYITEEKADTLGSSNVYQYDLVFPHRGSIGEVGIILNNERYVLSSSLMKLTCDRSKVNPKFLYYFFKSRLGRHELLKNASQVGTPGIGQPLSSLKSIELRLPPLEVQDQVEEALSSLDDKMESNRQTNQTLEQIAQAIFKSWFVDFEPTRAKIAAKENGQNPQLAAMCAISGKPEAELEKLDTAQLEQLKATAALFPDALVESELGEIPEGWEITNLKEITSKIGSGATPRGGKGAYQQEGISQIRSMNVFDGKFVMKDLAYINEEQADKLKNVIVKNNDVLINITGASVTRCCIVPPNVLPARVNQHVCIVRADTSISPHYIYQSLTSSAGKSILFSLAKAGATREALTKSHIENFKVLSPGQPLLDAYGKQAASLEELGAQLSISSQSLGKLRDTLLPKLLSGELEVNAAETVT